MGEGDEESNVGAHQMMRYDGLNVDVGGVRCGECGAGSGTYLNLVRLNGRRARFGRRRERERDRK